MAIRRCEAGEHTYDDTQHGSCPYCRKTRLATPPGGNAGMGIGNGMGNIDIPPPMSPPPMQAKTTPAPGAGDAQSGGGPKTRVVFGGGSGEAADFGEVMPVVGWLVVINGKGRGQDLRIVPGMNHIGREKGEILLNFGDTSVSREKHARVAYDVDENTFLLSHAEGRSLTKVNGKTIMDTYELNAYDHIRMGETEMIFVPLCGQNFSWNTPEA